jgi:hypothetical protein
MLRVFLVFAWVTPEPGLKIVVLASWRIRGEELVVSPDLCDVFGCGLLHPRYPRPRAGQVVVPAAALADERVRPSRTGPCGEPPVRANRKIAPTVISVMATPVFITAASLSPGAFHLHAAG